MGKSSFTLNRLCCAQPASATKWKSFLIKFQERPSQPCGKEPSPYVKCRHNIFGSGSKQWRTPQMLKWKTFPSSLHLDWAALSPFNHTKCRTKTLSIHSGSKMFDWPSVSHNTSTAYKGCFLQGFSRSAWTAINWQSIEILKWYLFRFLRNKSKHV
jgi:hypothetical protein